MFSNPYMMGGLLLLVLILLRRNNVLADGVSPTARFLSSDGDRHKRIDKSRAATVDDPYITIDVSEKAYVSENNSSKLAKVLAKFVDDANGVVSDFESKPSSTKGLYDGAALILSDAYVKGLKITQKNVIAYLHALKMWQEVCDGVLKRTNEAYVAWQASQPSSDSLSECSRTVILPTEQTKNSSSVNRQELTSVKRYGREKSFLFGVLGSSSKVGSEEVRQSFFSENVSKERSVSWIALCAERRTSSEALSLYTEKAIIALRAIYANHSKSIPEPPDWRAFAAEWSGDVSLGSLFEAS